MRRRPSMSSGWRVLAMSAVVLSTTRCARLADLGNGVDTSPASVTGPQGDIPTDPNIVIKPESLSFGKLGCGTSSIPQYVTIQNTGDTPLPYKAQAPAGSSFRLEGSLEGIVGPKSTVTLNAFADPNVAGDNVADLLVTAGSAVQLVHATTTGTGPTFEIVQSTVAFGEVRKESGGTPVMVQVNNKGTDTLSVPVFTSSDPAFVVDQSTLPLNVPAGGTSTFTVLLPAEGTTATDDPAMINATLTPMVGKICGPTPIVNVSGRRVTSDFTVSDANFGDKPCATTPDPMDITLANFANQPVNYTLKPDPATAFTFSPAGPGTVLAAMSAQQPSKVTISVTPKMLGSTAPLLEITEMLGFTLVSQAPNVGGSRTSTLHVRPRGAILAIDPLTMTFKSEGTQNYKVTNTGNQDISLSWKFVVPGPGWGASNPAPGSFFPLGGGDAQQGSISFKAGPGNGGTSTLTPSQVLFGGTPQCSGFPSVTATYTGK